MCSWIKIITTWYLQVLYKLLFKYTFLKKIQHIKSVRLSNCYLEAVWRNLFVIGNLTTVYSSWEYQGDISLILYFFPWAFLGRSNIFKILFYFWLLYCCQYLKREKYICTMYWYIKSCVISYTMGLSVKIIIFYFFLLQSTCMLKFWESGFFLQNLFR